MNTLNEKNIIVGITGGIAAYKAADLVRRLKDTGVKVRVVMTKAAQEFITPLTLQAVSGNVVHTDLLDTAAEAAMGHIELARWANMVVIAPASADFMARLAYGHADDLLTTLCLATAAPIILVPAMNQQMWRNVATQENVNRLLNHGMHFFGPAEGSQACGESGPGRMPEPIDIWHYLNNLLQPKILKGKRVLITAGPTREDIDPVRFMSNRSSGKMGFALAEAAVAAGGIVTMITGPVCLPTPFEVERITVETTQQMYEQVLNNIKDCEIFISTAAVADYRCKKPAAQKIKKTNLGEEGFSLQLIENPDILMHVANLKSPPFIVGFAAETEQVLVNAKKKLKEKKLNLIVANRVGKNQGFEDDYNQATVLWPRGKRVFSLAPKNQLAYELIQLIAERYHAKNTA